MHRLLAVVLCLSIVPHALAARKDRDAVRVAEARHLILEPQHVLTPEEIAQLAGAGVEVQRPLTGGRYLIRVAATSTFDENDLLVRSLRAIDPAEKIDASARRAASRARTAASVAIVFHDDVDFETARATILAAGGSLADPLATRFGNPRVMRGNVPAGAIERLAADDRVLMIRGARRLRARPDNVTSATLSNVHVVQSAPYNLTGNGVNVAIFELGPAFDHADFGGRLTRVQFENCNRFYSASECTQNRSHATHVAGTIGGSGAGNAAAKGMAPAVRMFEFDAGGEPDEYQPMKMEQLTTRNITVDNNSWGYDLGWIHDGRWIWQDTEEYLGGYDAFYTAPLDVIVRQTGVLAVHSSGNAGANFGPTSPPYQHYHVDDDFEVIAGRIYCYSANGSGNDCPSPCTPGRETCETTRHPVNAPFLSIGITASAKNILTVGATDNAKSVAGYSSRGPAADGRVKPELVARGGSSDSRVLSTLPDNSYGSSAGTSMAAPVISGIAALMVEQWGQLTGGAKPSPTLLKTVLIATAEDVGTPGPDYSAGFGLANAKAAIDLLREDANSGRRIRSGTVTQGTRLEVPLALNARQTLRVALSWPDPDVLIFDPQTDLAAVALVNDLDLSVIDPAGNTVLPFKLDKNNPAAAATRGVNTIDNTEVVEIANAAPGNYKIVLTAKINDNRSPSQPYVLVSNGEIGAIVAPCVDVHEPNDTPDAAYGLIPTGQVVVARTCAATDVDHYRFRVDRPGTVRITVTAGDTALRVFLTGGGSASIDVPANATRTLQFEHVGAPATYTVGVSPVGNIGLDARYTLTATFPTNPSTRRRSAR